jgi:lactobin A/cerein 7B family class IIb bacteriocin
MPETRIVFSELTAADLDQVAGGFTPIDPGSGAVVVAVGAAASNTTWVSQVNLIRALNRVG